LTVRDVAYVHITDSFLKAAIKRARVLAKERFRPQPKRRLTCGPQDDAQAELRRLSDDLKPIAPAIEPQVPRHFDAKHLAHPVGVRAREPV
jgi:hypothetical protein